MFWLGLLAMAASAIALFVAGVDKNAQITELHSRGIAVEVRIIGCVGQLGGSGSNAAGYACTGSYVVDGRRYVASIPGDTLREPGTSVRAVSVASDPQLISTAAIVAGERASSRVFIAPIVLSALVALALFGFALGRARRRAA